MGSVDTKLLEYRNFITYADERSGKMFVAADFGIIVVLIALVLGVAATTALSAAQWLAANIPIVAVLLLLKSVFIVGSSAEILRQKQKPIQLAGNIAAILLDVVRSGAVIWILADGVFTAFNGGLFHFIITSVGLFFGGGIVIAASLVPMQLQEESPLLAEILSVLALALCCAVIYGVFDGW